MPKIRRSVLWLAALALGAGSLTVLAGVAATGAGATPAGPVTMYVATTGSDTANACVVSATPCATIEHAITEAETIAEPVTIEVAAGTYGEQVTVPPIGFTGTFAPTTLTIEANPANASPVVVKPPAAAFTTTANLPTVPAAGQAYDSFGGAPVHALIGVGQLRTGKGPSSYVPLSTQVNIEGLTVSGANNTTTRGHSGYVAGIAYVDASGTIGGNTVTDLDHDPALWSANLENGIDVRGVNQATTTASYSVTISGNTLGSPTASVTNWIGHVPIDVNSTGDAATTVTGAGSLAATITGNTVYGTPIDATMITAGARATTSQNGIEAAGLTSLKETGNTVTGMQSAGFGGAVGVGPMAAGASCSVTGNQLTGDDYGISFAGARDCTASGNTITTGYWGVSVDPVPAFTTAGRANQPSVGDTVSGNTITGTRTVLTGDGYTDQPIDGVLVDDGATTAVTGNSISGFVTDAYVGVDPLRYGGTDYGQPKWATTTVPTTVTYGLNPSTWSTAGTVLHGNDLGALATPHTPSTRSAGHGSTVATATSYGVACKYTPGGGGCSATAPLNATTNWWNSSSGPSGAGKGSGVPVSTDVDYTPWWVTPTGASPGTPAAPTGVTAVAPSTSTLVNAAKVSWTAPPATVTAVTSYTVTPTDQTTGGQGTPVVVKGTGGAPATTATVTNLTGGDSYVFTVTATNAAGTGPAGTSNPVVPVKVAPSASSSSGTTIPSTGTATTKPVTAPASGPNGSPVTVTASGTGPAGGAGTVTVSAYPSDPTSGFSIGSAYFDVSIAPGSTFTQVQFQACGVPSGQVIQWWNALKQQFQPASTQTAAQGATRCVTVTVNKGTSPSLTQMYGTVFTVAPPSTPSSGYWLAASDGGVFTYGSASFYGSMGGKPLNKPIVGIAATPDNGGYWLVASDGGVFSFGDATFYGSMGGKPLNSPVVGIASTLDGKGYWEVAADGGIFAFGDATFYGSMGGKPLNQPVVGMTATPDGQGYWLVAKDGGIFSFGDATFAGSMGGKPLNQPVVGIAAGPSDSGYWEVAADGGIFTFGTATFDGSAGSLKLNKPVVGMAATPTTGGYYLVASDGGIFAYGDATFQGSAGSLKLNQPVVGMAD